MRTIGGVFVVIGAVVAGRSLLTVLMNELSRPFSKKPYPMGTPKTFLRMAAVGLVVVGVGLLLKSAP